MSKICMLRLGSTNLLYESVFCQEAETLGKGHEVVALDITGDGSPKRERIRNFDVERIALYTKSLPKNTFFWAIKYAEYLLRTSMRAISKNADVYHAYDLPCVMPAYFAAKANRAKVIYDCRELFTETPGKNKLLKVIWKSIERKLIKRVDKVIAANESRAMIMHNEYGAPQLPAVIMNCPPIRKIYPTEKLQKYLEQHGVKNKKIALYQGGLFPDRCLEEVVRSAKYLKDDIVIIFLGYGGLRHRLMRVAVDEGVANRVFFHDAVTSDEVLSYTASAHLGIVIYKNTCRNNYYCASTKLFEYIMAGIPVAGCDFPEVAKAVYRYKIGELFDPEVGESIASAMNCILEDKHRYERMKKNTEIARNVYNWETEEKKLIQLYKDLKKGIW